MYPTILLFIHSTHIGHVTAMCRRRRIGVYDVIDVISGDHDDVIVFPVFRHRQLVAGLGGITVVDERRLVPDLTA